VLSNTVMVSLGYLAATFRNASQSRKQVWREGAAAKCRHRRESAEALDNTLVPSTTRTSAFKVHRHNFRVLTRSLLRKSAGPGDDDCLNAVGLGPSLVIIYRLSLRTLLRYTFLEFYGTLNTVCRWLKGCFCPPQGLARLVPREDISFIQEFIFGQTPYEPLPVFLESCFCDQRAPRHGCIVKAMQSFARITRVSKPPTFPQKCKASLSPPSLCRLLLSRCYSQDAWSAQGQCAMAEFTGRSEEELLLWLESHGINTSLYGKGASKPVSLLLEEVLEGESALSAAPSGAGARRKVAVINVALRNRAGQTLYESHQVLPTGVKRSRNLPLSEKMLPGEEWREAVVRGIQEELGPVLPPEAKVIIDEDSYYKQEEQKDSQSYPGLATTVSDACAMLEKLNKVGGASSLARLNLVAAC